MSALNFNASEHAPSTGAAVVPADEYLMRVAEAEMKPGNKDPVNSLVIRLKYEIVDGQYTGRFIYGTINFKNANPQAEEIGRGELSALCHAIGRPHLTDVNQLVGPVFKAKVGIDPPNNGYDEKNTIKKWMLQDGSLPQQGQFGGAPAGTPTGAPTSAPTTAPQTQGAAPAGAPAQQPTTAPSQAPQSAPQNQPTEMPPAAPTAPAAQAPAVETPQQRMLVDDFTYEQYVASGWSEEALVANGKMRPVAQPQTAPAPQQAAPAPAPAAPAQAAPTPDATPAAAPTQNGTQPPWLQN